MPFLLMDLLSFMDTSLHPGSLTRCEPLCVRGCMCVCVCVDPCFQGSTLQFLLFTQGATAPFISLWPTKLLIFGEDMNLGRQVHVITCDRFELLLTLFQSLLFVSMVVPRYLPETFLPSATFDSHVQQPRVFCSHVQTMLNNTFPRTLPPFRSITTFPGN